MSVLVIGMHRSGTSMLTRCISLLGFSVGSGALMPPRRDNPKGFWEQESLSAFNDELLARWGGSWRNPPLACGLNWPLDAELAPLRTDARRTFAAAFDAQAWVWKDPRNCLTLAFWRQVLDEQLCVVFVHRHPLDICRSLHERDEIAQSEGLALWEAYVYCSLTQMAGLPVLVTEYHKLVERPREELAAVAGFLARHEPAVKLRDLDAAAKFVDASLLHWHEDQRRWQADPTIPERQRGLYRLLQELPVESAAFPELNLPVEHILSPLQTLERAERSRREAREQAREQARDQAAARETARLLEEIEVARRHIAKVERENDTARRYVQRVEAQLRAVENENAAAREHILKLEANQSLDEIHRLHAEIDRARQHIAHVEHEYRAAQRCLQGSRTGL